MEKQLNSEDIRKMKQSNTMSVAEYRQKMQSSGRSVKHGSPEHDAQVQVFQWAELMSNKYPELKLLMAIPNGAFYGTGNNRGMWAIAKKMKAEGVRKGVPDIFLPIPVMDVANSYMKAGLWIEMKAGKNKPKEEQKWWLEQLDEYGYRVEVCYGFQEAVDVISSYLRINLDE